MKREFSAGGIVFKTVRSQGSGDNQVLNNNGQVLLVKAGSLRDESKKHWKFPKGHVDPEEALKLLNFPADKNLLRIALEKALAMV